MEEDLQDSTTTTTDECYVGGSLELDEDCGGTDGGAGGGGAGDGGVVRAIAGMGEFNSDERNFETNLRRRKGKIISCAKETIENASRQLRRKVPYAGHLMTPRRLWLNKIPTQCDVVIEFPEDAPDEALRWLLSRIRAQPPAGLGLIVQVKAHESTRRNAFYISAPTNILFKAAEEARLPKRLRSDLGGALREFTTRESHCFQQLSNADGSSAATLFTSQERQWLVLQVLQGGLRAGQSDMDALHGRAAVAEGQSIVAAWQEMGLIVQVFPLHETQSLAQLQRNWVKQIFAPQPLDDIAEYFGVKVALYFAWLGHYTCALGVPAVFGSILYIVLWGKGQMAQDMGHVLFSLFNVAWASLYLEAWKRYSVELAFRWGTLSTPPELLEPPRPLYKGPLVENNVTGRLEPMEAPAWQRRAFRYLVSFPIIALCLLLVFAVMFLMLRFQDWWDSKLPEEGILCCLSVIPKVLLAGAITLMDEAYYKLAVWLNDHENYRLQSKYENHLIAKVGLFQFVNSFLSLFYIAFYLRDEEKLKEQLAGLLISRQIIGNLRESAVPYILEQWKLAKLSFNMWGALSPTQYINRTIMDPVAEQQIDTNTTSTTATTNTPLTSSIEQLKMLGATPQQTPTRGGGEGGPGGGGLGNKRNIGQAEIESTLYKYDGTFSDHLEMLVQMGYVVLFSAAFPLAGICALINNLMEIRSDAFKLAHVHQRPFGQRVANIGTWQNAFSALSLAAVIVNCALIGLSGQVSRLWPGLTTAQTIILIVTLEHIMLGLRSALTWLLPELPSWLAAEIARAEHCRREMQCKGTSPRPTPPSPPSTTSSAQPDQEVMQMEAVLVGGGGGGRGITAAHCDDMRNDQSLADELLYQEQQQQLQQQQQHLRYRTRSTGGGGGGGHMSPPPPYTDELAQFGLQRGAGAMAMAAVEADVNVYETRDSSPDSPPSQTSTILIRPLHESTPTPPQSGTSLTSLNQDAAAGHGTSVSSANISALGLRQQAMHIPEIPPFRKKSSDSAEHTGSSASSSPRQPMISTPLSATAATTTTTTPPPTTILATTVGKLQEIPPFKARKVSAESTSHLHMSELTSNTETTDILKPAPSWSNVAVMKSNTLNNTTSHHHQQHLQQQQPQQHHHHHHQQQQQPHMHQQQQQMVASTSSSSGGSGGRDGGTAAAPSRPSVSGVSNSSSMEKEQQQQPVAAAAANAKGTSTSQANTTGTADDEAKAAELAAKKSRLRQKLVKSARSVGIFSLKLKERRQREAEKAANIAIEHAKALAKMPPQAGGELSLIPIEQLIQIEDIMPALNSNSNTAMKSSTASTAAAAAASVAAASATVLYGTSPPSASSAFHMTSANATTTYPTTTGTTTATASAAATSQQQQQQQHYANY